MQLFHLAAMQLFLTIQLLSSSVLRCTSEDSTLMEEIHRANHRSVESFLTVLPYESEKGMTFT